MARYSITGKRYSKKSMLGISLIVVLALAVVSIAVAAIVLPGMVEAHEGSDMVNGAYQRPVVEAIVPDNNYQISVDAQLSQVFVTVKYSNGTSERVALSELVVEGLDTTKEGEVDVSLDFGGFKQKVTYTVVPTTLTVEYLASSGGRIRGETKQQVIAGGNASSVEAIPNEGYRFDGWSDGYSSPSRLDKQISKSTKLIARFSKSKYTVVFYYPDGTTAREEIVPYGDAPTKVPRPDEKNMELYGYNFVGWDPVDFSHIYQDTNIYPTFEKYATDFHVEFSCDKEGNPLGSIQDLKDYYPKGQKHVIYLKENLDRKFIGWQIRSVNGDWVTLRVSDAAINTTVTESVQITRDRTITFESNYVMTSDSFTLAFTIPDDDATHTAVNDIYIKVDLVYEESVISFTSMSNEVFMPRTLKYGAPISDILDVNDATLVTNKGYNFLGWYDVKHPYNEDGTPALIDENTIFEQDTELAIFWEKCLYKAVFLKGDNEDVNFTDASQGYDAALGGRVLEVLYQNSLSAAETGSFPSEIPVKENYTFKGWYRADRYLQPTDYVIDRNYKIENEIDYIVPVFEVNTRVLTTALNGSGNAYYLVYNSQYNADVEVAITGAVKMAVTEDFTVRVRHGKDYKVTAAKLNSEDIMGDLVDKGGYYDIVIRSIIRSDYVLQMDFSLEDYEVAVTNGTPLSSGTVSYNVAGASEALKQTSVAVDFAFRADSGMSINLEIFAPEDCYIASVSIDGVVQTIPRNATYYTLVLSSIGYDKSVVIVYNESAYVVNVPIADSMSHGAITPAVSVPQYNGGDSPVFYVTAEEGYYIKGVRANGSIIDPYNLSGEASGYTVRDILVNGVEAATREYDYRITSMTVVIERINRDVTFELDIAPMYYKIKTQANGVGEVTKSTEVGYGEECSIFASTVTGYYVAAVTVNGDRIQISGKASEAMYSLTSVKRDYEITFDFERAMHVVTFMGGAGVDEDSASIIYDEKSYSYGASGRTFADIPKGGSAEFTLVAPEGNYIYSISVKDMSDATVTSETVGFNAESYVLRFDNVVGDYEISVIFDVIEVQYSVYLLCPEGTMPDMTTSAGDRPVSPVYPNQIAYETGRVIYGSTLTIDINTDSTVLLLDNIKVINAEDTPYYYEATSGALVSSPNRGQYTLIGSTVNVIDIDTAVDIYIQLVPADFGSTHNVTIAYSGVGTLTASATGNVAAGTVVTFTATPTDPYTLKALIINGTQVLTTDNTYTMVVNEDVSAFAIFDEYEYKISVNAGGNGTINTNVTRVARGNSFEVIVIPAIGHTVSDFSLKVGNGGELRPSYDSDESGIVRYTVSGTLVTDDVLVSATFSPKKYNVTINYSGNGRVNDVETGKIDIVDYGVIYSMGLFADNGYFVSKIEVGGIGISPNSLGGEINSETNTVVSANLDVEITADTVINVVFAPNVYVVTVAETVGGTTLIKRVSENGTTAYVDPKSITFGAGDELWVKASAIEGYHLETLRVNGEVNTEWFDPTVNVNDFSEVYVKVADISGNVTLRVAYAVNEYSIKVNATNKSLNFAEYDDTPSAYGTVTISGYTQDSDGTYRGINHGANVRINIAPRTARGYYISLFQVVYADGLGTTYNLTGDINAEGGAYILQNLSADIFALNVEFKRRTFTYAADLQIESLGSAYACQGGVNVTFTNPYSSSKQVLSDNGSYEYGLSYTVNVNPGAGYSRTEFTVNGEDRLRAIKSNNYSGIINSNLVFGVVYEINVYEVSYHGTNGGRYYIRTESGDLVWQPGVTVVAVGEIPPAGVTAVSAEQTTPGGGMIWIDIESGVIKVTFNTALVFVTVPESSNGYGLTEFKINNFLYERANGDIENSFYYSVVSDTNVEATFDIHEYNIRVNEIEGGMVATSANNVKWGSSVQIDLSLNVGFVLKSVEINGESRDDALVNLSAGIPYVIYGVRENINIVLTVEKKPYDITFIGDGYNKESEITASNGVKFNLQAVTGVEITSGVLGAGVRSFYSNREGDINPENGKVNGNLGSEYTGLRYSDKLTVKFMPPEGYEIANIQIIMDRDGYNAITLLSSVAELDIDDGSGSRTYMINNVTGNVVISVTYEIKTYKVIYENREGGRYTPNDNTSGTTLSYYNPLNIKMQSDNGYYLKSLTINGNDIGVEVRKSGASYIYTTYVEGENSDIIDELLEVNASILNSTREIRVIPIYERQYFNVVFYVQGSMVASGGYSADNTLGLYIEGGRIIYSKDGIPTTIEQTLRSGFSINNVVFSHASAQPQDALSDIPVKVDAVTGVNQYSAKSSKLELLLTDKILEYLDFSNPAKNTLRIYYTTSQDKHTGTLSNYVIEVENGVNKGKAHSNGAYFVNGIEVFTTKISYSDNTSGAASHDYGTKATLTAQEKMSERYRFEGFQELIDGTWRYVRNGENGITMDSNLMMSYTMTSNRVFRAVFFRMYKVTVEIHPRFKYVGGSFRTYDPSQMMYRLYATMSAEAIYSANEANGVPMPDILGVRETLESADGDATSGIYTYYIRSGGSIVMRGADRYSTNLSQGFSYNRISYDAQGKRSYIADSDFVNTLQGKNITQDTEVYAYAQNSMYVSFQMESIGASVANAGGELSYTVQGSPVTLMDNSLSMVAGQRLVVTITPKKGYRFESVTRLVALSTPDVNGYMRFTNNYEPLDGSTDSRISFEQDGNSYKLTLSNWDENTIIKVSFRKQVTLTRGIELFGSGLTAPKYTLVYTDDSTADGVYDYGTNVHFDIQEGMSLDNRSGAWRSYYQFVGYFINGVDNYKQLAQFYPATNSIDLVLNDLDGLSNGISLIEKIDPTDNSVTYNVSIVAKFIPVYNIVIENEYVESSDGEPVYHNPGSVIASAAMYDSVEKSPQYYTSSYNVEAVAYSGHNTAQGFSMLGSINSVTMGAGNTATSPYNVWNDNMLTLQWDSTSIDDSDSYRFVSWQYRVYVAGEGFKYVDINYNGGGSTSTNGKSRSTLTFPISFLHNLSYASRVGTDGDIKIDGNIDTTWVYDYNDNGKPIYAIVIRPKFQKVVMLTLNKATAIDTPTVFIEGEGDVEPKIASNSLPSGSFNYGTVQTISPSVISGYNFVGWYVAYDSADLSAAADILTLPEVDRREINAVTYIGVSVLNSRYDETILYYSVNNATEGSLRVVTDDSYTIVARYTRIYNLTIKTSSISGDAYNLTKALPYVKYYRETSTNVWELVNAEQSESEVRLSDIPVGTRLKIKLDVGYDVADFDANDLSHFNPRFDRFKQVYVYDEKNTDIFESASPYSDFGASTIPEFGGIDNYVTYINTLRTLEVVVCANANKTVSITFESFGELTIDKIYWGSGVKLPEALANVLKTKIIKDGGEYDGDNVANGVIVIKNIPITMGETFDGKQRGDYANQLIEGHGNGIIDNNIVYRGINFDGHSESVSKMQTIVYYDGVDVEYPFEDGDKASAGNGKTKATAFKIGTVEQLRSLDALYRGSRADLSGIYFVLTGDITLNIQGNALGAALCSPYIDDSDNKSVYRANGFNGIFNGGGHRLKNLYLDMSGVSNVGLFAATTTGAVIEDLYLENFYVSGSVNVGALVGEAVNTSIKNVHVIGANGQYDQISGANNVGGLIGYAHVDGVNVYDIVNVSVQEYTIYASAGATYSKLNGFDGGAGGLIGKMGAYVRLRSSTTIDISDPTNNGTTFVSSVNVAAKSGAGGIVGTLSDMVGSDTAIENVIALDPVLNSYNNELAIGGLVGAIGKGRNVVKSYLILTRDTTITSVSALVGAYANFKVPNANNIFAFGAGGIAGHNMGTVDNCHTIGAAYQIQFSGSMVGGIVGVNQGTVKYSSAGVRTYASRSSSGSSYAGGSYGGIVGVNWLGSVENVNINITSSNDYNPNAAIEVVTNDRREYIPKSGTNGDMHETGVANDPTTVYVGGLVGFNNAVVSDSSFTGKVLFNRRSTDAAENNSYMAAGVAYNNATSSTMASVSVTNSYVKLFHYIYVDQTNEDKDMMQFAHIGGVYCNTPVIGENNSSSNVTATAEYCGGGTKYKKASIELGFEWGFAGTEYASGSATVYFTNVANSSAWSVVPTEINDHISDLADDNAVYSPNCEKEGGDISTLWKNVWNYIGYLRHIKVTVG